MKEKEIKLGAGVIQGGMLSPTLFLIMFDDLIKTLVNEKLDTFAFADDLAVNSYDEKKLKKAIEMIELWADANLMKINKKKLLVIFTLLQI